MRRGGRKRERGAPEPPTDIQAPRRGTEPARAISATPHRKSIRIIAHALHRSTEEDQIMDMPAPQAITTIAELLALPEDGLRHELLDGQHVVTPSPKLEHQGILSRLFSILSPAVAEHADVVLCWSPADVHLGPRTLVQPDLFIARLPDGGLHAPWRDLPTPLLVIEVLSPSTAARDRGAKRRIYLDAGVEEYWIVDIDARLIERWRPRNERPEIIDEVLRWELSIGPSGAVDVTKLFDGL
jgi:Uma2 family endonuclease